jgi:hypothetical protein
VTLLQRTTQLSSLDLDECSIVRGMFDSDAVAVHLVSQCFADRCTLQTLYIDFNYFNEAYFCAILEALKSSRSVETLKLAMNVAKTDPLPIAVINAVVSLFQSPVCPLARIYFEEFTWTGRSFEPLAQSLQTSPMLITNIYFVSCQFDEIASKHLPSVFARGLSRPYDLSLAGSVKFPKVNDYQVVFELVTNLPAELGFLSLFDFCSFGSDKKRFRAIVRALTSKSCVVQRFSTDELSTPNLAILLNAMPQFEHLRFLSFTCNGNEHQKHNILTAFRRNRSLFGSHVEIGRSFSP